MSNFCGSSHHHYHHNLIRLSLILLVSWVAVASRDGGMMKIKTAISADDNINDTADVAEFDRMVSSIFSRDDFVQMGGYGEEKLSTVLITGTVVCDQDCSSSSSSSDQLQVESHPVSGAIVAATCQPDNKYAGKENRATTAHQGEGVTDDYGEFIIDLPSHLHAIPAIDKACSVMIVKLPKNSPCGPSSASIIGLSKGLQLSSFGNGIRTYSAGTIQFTHNARKQSKAACTKAIKSD